MNHEYYIQTFFYFIFIYKSLNPIMLVTFQICGGSSSIGGGGRACGKMPVRAPKIPQLDGPIPDPYEELSTPNVKTILKILHVAHIIYVSFYCVLYINNDAWTHEILDGIWLLNNV